MLFINSFARSPTLSPILYKFIVLGSLGSYPRSFGLGLRIVTLHIVTLLINLFLYNIVTLLINLKQNMRSVNDEEFVEYIQCIDDGNELFIMDDLIKLPYSMAMQWEG